MSLTFIVLLAVMILVSLQDSYRTLLNERKNQIQEQVQTAVSLIEGYVKQAQAGKLTQEQAQAAAKRAVGSLRFGKDGYFWINNMHPSIVMHPIKPELDGRDVSTFTDKSGKLLYVDMVNVVKEHGGGFVSYVWPLPGGTEPVAKIAYVQGIPEWGWVVGSGLYLVDTQQAFRQELMALGGVGALVLIGALLLTAWLGRSITRPLGAVTRQMAEIAEGEGDLTRRLDATRSDEIGDLSGAFNRFVERIQRLVGQVAGSTSQLSAAAEELSATSEE
ncbi:MAG: methyl-accepting chemotaxis protein, partial [Acidihalobacter sp.]